MFRIVFIVSVYCMCVSGSGIFHESSKITFSPDSVPQSKYFGYSVLLNHYGLIVGAPKATNRERSIASGVVFNCTLQELDRQNVTCYPIMITDKDQINVRFRKLMPDNFFKEDMWFGATIGAITDGKLLICAPRYTEPYSENHRLVNGVCYVRKNNRDFVVYPLRDKTHQAFRTDGSRPEYGEYGQHLVYYAYGQAGMSVKVTGTNQVIIGAPGLLQWTGGIVNYRYSPDDNSQYFSPEASFNPYYTKDMGPDDYFGYSVESGVFEKKGSMLFIGGAPRAKSGYGLVLVFEPAIREQEALNIRAKLQGPQLFSYFGASLCCLDIDGDGVADLLVGAPNYAKKDGGLPYDQGAVFIYMTKQTNSSFYLEDSGSVSGSGESGARFGTTIADLGDVDGDGFKDVAIGAPWENDGLGVVYIYRGYDKGLRKQYTQRIIAEGAGSFGISISKGLDVDRNNCNDLAIGAATSTKVYLYRCVPTVLVHTSIKVPDAMNLPHNATGFTALFCVTLPKKPLWPHVKIDFKAKIIIDPEGNRATISGDSKYEYKVTATPGNERCDEQTVEVKPTADLSKPISMKFELDPDEIMKNDTVTFNNHAARVSEESDLQSTFLIQLVRDCGEDMICTPWLVMTLDALNNPFIPGTDTKLGVRLTILNKEEPAYGARVNISLPIIPKRVPSLCSLEGLVMTCDVPAPLLRDEKIVWDIVLDYNLNSSSEANLKVVAELEDSLYYRNISKDLLIDLELNVVPEASFNISGKPPQNGTVAVSREKLNDAENITFVNYIEIMNLGPSDWYHLEVHILFDMVTLSSPIKDCENDGVILVCVLSVPANISISIVLPLRLDLGLYGYALEQNNTLNTTTSVFLFWKENEPSLGLFSNTTIITTLVLDPVPPIWPLILGIVAGLIFGLLLLALIVYLLHKNGFFSRNRYHQRLKDQHESSSDNELEESEGPSTAAGNASTTDSTKELLFEDSD